VSRFGVGDLPVMHPFTVVIAYCVSANGTAAKHSSANTKPLVMMGPESFTSESLW
jgi:hypothetical protein